MTDINRLISLGIEIEGLLRVLEHRGSSEIRDLLAAKFEDYSALMQACLRRDESSVAAPVLSETPEAHRHPVDVASVPDMNVAAEPAEPEAAVAPVKAQEAEEPEVVDEMDATAAIVARNDDPAAPRQHCSLMKAFTLNDKFRFRRELFAGDDEDFVSTVALLEQMPSYEEAADYLYHDLLWDRRDEVVAEFMEILKSGMPA